MSQENVEVIRGGYEAFNRGEVESAITALGAPDFEFVPAGRVPGVEDVYRGAEGFRQFLRFFWGMFDDARVEVHEFLDTVVELSPEDTRDDIALLVARVIGPR